MYLDVRQINEDPSASTWQNGPKWRQRHQNSLSFAGLGLLSPQTACIALQGHPVFKTDRQGSSVPENGWRGRGAGRWRWDTSSFEQNRSHRTAGVPKEVISVPTGCLWPGQSRKASRTPWSLACATRGRCCLSFAQCTGWSGNLQEEAVGEERGRFRLRKSRCTNSLYHSR